MSTNTNTNMRREMVDAIDALTHLGYKPLESRRIAYEALRRCPEPVTVERLIRECLRSSSEPDEPDEPITPATPVITAMPPQHRNPLPIPPRSGWFAAMTLWAGTIWTLAISVALGPIAVRPVCYWLGDHWAVVHVTVALCILLRLWPAAWARVQRIAWFGLYLAGLLGMLLSLAGCIAGVLVFVLRTS